jgi:hypothetical protein
VDYLHNTGSSTLSLSILADHGLDANMLIGGTDQPTRPGIAPMPDSLPGCLALPNHCSYCELPPLQCHTAPTRQPESARQRQPTLGLRVWRYSSASATCRAHRSASASLYCLPCACTGQHCDAAEQQTLDGWSTDSRAANHTLLSPCTAPLNQAGSQPLCHMYPCQHMHAGSAGLNTAQG